MRNIVNYFLISLFITISFVSCASNEKSAKVKSSNAPVVAKVNLTQEEYLKQLNQSFDYFKKFKYQENQEVIDSFFVHISEESRDWINSMVDAVEMDDSTTIVNRSFYEILTVLGIRLLYRNNVIQQVDSANVLNVMTGKFGILKRAFTINQLGEMWFVEKEGYKYGYRGMASSPKVPVFYFIWSDEENRWQLNLVQMLPIISRGLETVGLKQNWSNSETALHILKSLMDYQVDNSLLQPY